MTTDTYESSAWSGWAIFAAIVMLTIGTIDIIQGLVALLKDETYLITESGLLVTTNFTAWGWSLLIWGIVLILAGAALFGGQGVGALVRHRRRHRQHDRPDRLVPGVPAVEPGGDRAWHRRLLRPHGALAGGEE